MAVAHASGMSEDSSWERDDAVVPVMEHFAADGAPESGLNAAPIVGHGVREVLVNLLAPSKAVRELGGARVVMMAGSKLDNQWEVEEEVHTSALLESVGSFEATGMAVKLRCCI